MKYEIRVEGVLDQRWSAWFDGVEITNEPGGITVIAGDITDQAALRGLLIKIQDVGVTLISMHRIDPHETNERSDPA